MLERETCWYKSSPSLTCTPISPVSFFGGCVCEGVPVHFLKRTRGVCVCLWTDNSSQDASAAGGDLGAGGTLLLGERGFFGL